MLIIELKIINKVTNEDIFNDKLDYFSNLEDFYSKRMN